MSPNVNEPRSCGAGREFGKAKLADHGFHGPCWCLDAPPAFDKADASEKRKVLWADASLCVGLAPAEPRRHREHTLPLPKKHCYCVVLAKDLIKSNLCCEPSKLLRAPGVLCWMAQLFLKGPLVEISACTWCTVLDGPSFSQRSLSRNFCVHLVYCAGWPDFFSEVP